MFERSALKTLHNTDTEVPGKEASSRARPMSRSTLQWQKYKPGVTMDQQRTERRENLTPQEREELEEKRRKKLLGFFSRREAAKDKSNLVGDISISVFEKAVVTETMLFGMMGNVSTYLNSSYQNLPCEAKESPQLPKGDGRRSSSQLSVNGHRDKMPVYHLRFQPVCRDVQRTLQPGRIDDVTPAERYLQLGRFEDVTTAERDKLEEQRRKRLLDWFKRRGLTVQNTFIN